jgi:secondary thiamine-phosphate synthase enzyme
MIELQVKTQTHSELLDITPRIQHTVTESGVQEGVCHVFVPHTSAGLVLNENWDPDVRADIVRALSVMVPDVPYQHAGGNSPAHLLSAVVGSSATLLIQEGRLFLSKWQGVYLAEFDGPRQRRVMLKIVADPA